MEIDGLGEWFDSFEVGQMQRGMEEQMITLLFNQELSDFKNMVAQLAWVGSSPENRALLERDIIELDAISIEEAGFFKNVWKATRKTCEFIANHAAEIAIGVGVVAASTAIIATGGTASVVVGGVVVAGAGSLFASNQKSSIPIAPNIPPLSKTEQEALPRGTSALPKLNFPDSVDEVFVSNEGIWARGQFFPNSTFAKNSHFAEEFAQLQSPTYIPHSDDISQRPIDNVAPKPQPSELPQVISNQFVVVGSKPSTTSHIGWINGIANSSEESEESAAYIQQLAAGHEVSGIYNRSHTPLVDLAECAVFNHFLRVSIITSDLLRNQWEAFHELNKDNPDAKLLQICHSQGAIHVRNTLESVPQEIRDRIFVIAIAPAAIVPKHLCFNSFNYASRNDIVNALEPYHLRSFPLVYDSEIWPSGLENSIGFRDELIILEPHEDATGIDHSFQSPTFKKVLQDRIEAYNLYNKNNAIERKQG